MQRQRRRCMCYNALQTRSDVMYARKTLYTINPQKTSLPLSINGKLTTPTTVVCRTVSTQALGAFVL